MDTKAIAKEIVNLRSQVREAENAGLADSEHARTLRDRMRELQDRLADDTTVSEAKAPDTQADKVQFIPPS